MAINTIDSRLILASSSPRRHFLLKQAGFIFDVVPSAVDETKIRTDSPGDHARLLAEIKAKAVACQYPRAYVIGADTIVVVEEKILGKPVSVADARTMLKMLSGRAHDVLTGYAIQCEKKSVSESKTVCTTVQFKSLTEGEIEWYLNTQEPFDKAGSYAIQGQGAFMIDRISGSYTNVVGLPMSEVIDGLIQLGLANHLKNNTIETRHRPHREL